MHWTISVLPPKMKVIKRSKEEEIWALSSYSKEVFIKSACCFDR